MGNGMFSDQHPDWVRSSFTETLEYLAFLRLDDEFVYEDDTDHFGSGWNGVLVVRDID
jgi:hypothetical protein